MVYVLIQFLAKIHLTLDYTHHYTVTSTYLSYPAAAVGECTAVLSELELHRELAVIGDWQNLCLHLGVDGGTLDRLKFSSKQVEVKKAECLSAYYKLGEGGEGGEGLPLPQPQTGRQYLKEVLALNTSIIIKVVLYFVVSAIYIVHAMITLNFVYRKISRLHILCVLFDCYMYNLRIPCEIIVGSGCLPGEW